MKKNLLQVVFWGISLVCGYFLYASIMGPIEFAKEKEKRYAAVIAKLKDIRMVQDAHFSVHQKYAPDFKSLIDFIENGKFIITTKRDTSWTEFDKNYRIDMLRQGVVVDTLGAVAVKDSLFKEDSRYKEMMQVPYAQNTTFDLKSDVIEQNNYKSSVYEVKVAKKQVLDGLDEDEIAAELLRKGVEDVKGEFLSVGSLTEISTNGNWPTKYDAKLNKAARKN